VEANALVAVEVGPAFESDVEVNFILKIDSKCFESYKELLLSLFTNTKYYRVLVSLPLFDMVNRRGT
jgi:hypothetical protein